MLVARPVFFLLRDDLKSIFWFKSNLELKSICRFKSNLDIKSICGLKSNLGFLEDAVVMLHGYFGFDANLFIYILANYRYFASKTMREVALSVMSAVGECWSESNTRPI